jgi:hypothetical protein
VTMLDREAYLLYYLSVSSGLLFQCARLTTSTIIRYACKLAMLPWADLTENISFD